VERYGPARVPEHDGCTCNQLAANLRTSARLGRSVRARNNHLFVTVFGFAVCGAPAGRTIRHGTEAVVLVITIVGWDYLIDWLAWRYDRLRPWLKVPALTLIEQGRIVEENLRREMISRDDLAGQLRANGVRAPSEVELARLEEDGRVSVIKVGRNDRNDQGDNQVMQ
jgi:uncharacterized membrane protein YcaP (DUF421 family)